MSSSGPIFRERLVRGETFKETYDLYQNAGADGCGPQVQGPPLDLSSYTGFAANGEIDGVDTAILVTVTPDDLGAADRPAALTLTVDAEDARTRPYVDGAEEAFRIDVFVVRPGERRWLFAVEITMEDSAAGALR